MNYYHPQTLECIITTNPADWMGQTEIDPPAYNPQAQGCFWRGDAWELVDPVPEPLPTQTCTPWQIRKALNAQGLRTGVEAAIAASTDQTLKDGWEFASAFRSDDPFVISMGAALGKSEEETKLLIQYASTL